MTLPSDQDRKKSAGSFALSLLHAAAGLMGAAGVGLAAYAAHRVQHPALATAATMQMVHAAALLGLCAIAARAENPRPWIALGFVMQVSVSLFGLAVAHHALMGNHLFPYAAPIGGSGAILSWLAVAALAMREYFANVRE